MKSDIHITLNVLAPDGTDVLYLSGSTPELGCWKPDAVKFTSSGKQFRTELCLPAGDYEYKYTRGSWKSVEKGRSGEELGNRRLTVCSSCEKTDDVLAFADIRHDCKKD